jgi:outer membrane protein assembly factor BamB
VLDYDVDAAADTMRCLSLDNGLPVWTNAYPVLLTRNHGLSRTVPVIVGDVVISFGPRCHVAAWDAKSGHCRWLIDLVRDHGATVPRWYAGQCPLIDQDRLILAPCGESLLMAVDHQTGEVIWRSPNPRGWEMTHVSVMPMQWEGRRSYVYCGSGGVAAIAADDGTLLWDSPEWPSTFATCPSPLILPEGRVFLCSGYGRTTGSLILQVQKSADQWKAEPIVQLTPQQFNAEQQTPILFREHIFAIRKYGGGQLVCLNLAGNEVWSSGSDRFGHGPFLIADNLILVMDDRGTLTMVEATTDAYRRLGQCPIFPDGHDAWGPMAMVNGRLILRDMTRMACLDLSEGSVSN